MHCNICDKQLSEKEINWNEDINTFEPCGTCLDVIMDAAYAQGYDDEEQRVIESDFDDDTYYGDSSELWPSELEDEAYD